MAAATAAEAVLKVFQPQTIKRSLFISCQFQKLFLTIFLWVFLVCFLGNFFVPGATAATIIMLGVLHARRLYDDKKVIIIPSSICLLYGYNMTTDLIIYVRATGKGYLGYRRAR